MTIVDVEVPCITCAGEGAVDCADDRRVVSCTDDACKKHLHICINCRGSGLAKDQWFGPGIEARPYQVPRRSPWGAADEPY